MNTLIFEGIATSGKSSVIKRLQTALEGKLKIKVASEDETHVPIMEKTDELHIDFYLDLINRLTHSNPDLLIIDRLYLTQAFRVKTALKSYKEVEEALIPYNSLTVFLSLKQTTIQDRIDKAIQHRDSEWESYLASKGSGREEQAAYYIHQQNSQLELLKQSILPYKIFDTTDHNYEDIARQIIEQEGLEPKITGVI